MTRKRHRVGSHRALPPEETLARITPHLRSFGITRAADVTGLDLLGIPVYCAVRPRGGLLQVANGKGLRDIDAKVSALMEAIEYWHAEHPPAELLRASYEALAATAPACPPDALPWFRGGAFDARRLVLPWVLGDDLGDGAPIWVPAGAAWDLEPRLFEWSTNGLASGNTLAEATLHALLEVYERHALARLLDADGAVDLDVAEVLDLADAPGPSLGALRARIEAAGLRAVLLRVPSGGPIEVFAAALLDRDAFAASTLVNLGYGAHLCHEVAAVRAITEAAQQRATYIHGSRDDLPRRGYDEAPKRRLYDRFAALSPGRPWSDLADASTGDLDDDLALALAALPGAGLGACRRIVLSPPELPVTVVKVLVDGAEMRFARLM